MAMICQPAGYVDMTAAALVREHAESLRHILEDRDVDSVIVISIPPTFLPAMDVAKALVPVIKKSEKPVLVCFMRGQPMAKARAHLEESGIPIFDTPKGAAKALNALAKARIVKSYGIREMGQGLSLPLIGRAQGQGRDLLEYEALQFLSENGIPVMPYVLARKRRAAQSFAEALGVPAVLKIVSPHIIHKSEFGGVRLNLIGREAVGRAYERLLDDVRRAKPDADIQEFLFFLWLSPGPK